MIVFQNIELSKCDESPKKMTIKKKTEGEERQNIKSIENLVKAKSIQSVREKNSREQFARRSSEKMKKTPSPQSFKGKNINNFFFSPSQTSSPSQFMKMKNSKFKSLEFYQNQIYKEKQNIEGILLNTKISLFSKPGGRTKTEPMGISFGSNLGKKKVGKFHPKLKLKKNPE